jgi:serine/threonine protein kinase
MLRAAAPHPARYFMASVHQRYRILAKIDAGGMAEIYRGAAISIEGFEKPVAIKRILPSLCENEKFVAMFLDEARLTMQLNHANIVQILDIGKVDDTYFIAMEMVEGWNLRRVMQKSLDQGKPFPLAIACFLAMEIAKALAYAHEKNGPDGQSLGIVHRDVSPPNVLLSKEGEVKLTDFGLARAASNAQVSDHGVVKGKFAYLCPEAVEGKVVDPRADVYSTGIILWEMLCGRRLFAGKNDGETVELVRKGDIPKPSTLRPEVDAELDRIVLRSLAKNTKRRYQSAREMEQELAAFLFKHNLRVTNADLAAYLRDLDASGEVQVIDVVGLLRAEMDEQVRVGHLDPTIGHAPLKPLDLKAKSTSKVGVQDLLERLTEVPLDDLAEEGIHVRLADRLEAMNDKSQASQRILALKKSKGLPRWAIAVAAVGLLAVAALVAWTLRH